MTHRKRKILISLLLHAPFLLVLYFLQTTLFSSPVLFGVKPLLLPLAVIGVSLFEGPQKGGIFGIFAGILCDLSFNQPPIQFTLLMPLIGISAGIVCDTILARGFPSYVVITAVSIGVISFFQMFELLFFGGASFGPLFATAIQQVFCSLIFTIPIYYVSRAIGRRLKF